MSFVRTLPALIAKCKPETVDLRDRTESKAQQGFERYWRIALLNYPREQCGSVWVLGVKHGNICEWHSSTSIPIIKLMHRATKLHGDSVSFVVIEPMGTYMHRMTGAVVSKALETVEVALTFTDPNQQTIGF